MLNVIQFRRWGGRVIWDKEVLNNVIQRFGEKTFLTVCKALSIHQHANFQTKDSGGYEPSFNTIYYDLGS